MKSSGCFLIVIVMVLLNSFPDRIYANQLMFRHYKVEDGLSSNTVQCIMQDSKGFIWIGTSDGLNRFDTFNFKVYRHIAGDLTSLGNNSVQALYDDNNGHIWIGTDAGVFIYEHDTGRFRSFSLKMNGINSFHTSTFSITGDKNGNIWIATIGQGLFRYNTHSERLFQYKNNGNDPKSLSSDYVTKLLIDSEENLWIATTTEGLNVYDANKDNFVRYSPANGKGELNERSSFELFEDSFGNIWIGGWSKGLILYDKEKQQFTNHLCENETGIVQHIHSINEFVPGQLIIGSDNGLTFFTILSGKYTTITFDPFDSRGLNDIFVYPVFKDKEGGIWVGTYFGGINYLSPEFSFFDFYTFSPRKNSISGRMVSRFCEGSDGSIWIGTDDGGLNRFDPESKIFERIYINDRNEIPLNIHALCLDGDYLWIGTFNQGLYRLNTYNRTIRHYTKEKSIRSLNSQSIYSVFKDVSGNLWVGTQLGINLYNPETDDFSRVQEIGWGSDVVDIVQDSDGFVWFASQRKGIYVYNPRTKEFLNYIDNKIGEYFIPDNRINCLCIDNNNRIWAGTAGAGLCLYDRIENTFVRVETDDNIFDSAIFSIIPDHDDLWITTNKGLLRFNHRTKKVNRYTMSEGLQSNQFNPNAGIKSSSGDIFIGGVNGFNVFNPSAIKENPYIPPIVFTNFQLFNKDVPIGDKFILRESIESIRRIVLDSKQSVFSFEFIALSYCAPEKNRYTYMLEGFDKEWMITHGTPPKVTYTNLSPGNYLFKVKASNNDGIWNETENNICIIIKPPWWKARIMYVVYFGIVIGLAFSIYRFLLRRAKKTHDRKLKEIEKQKELELLDSKLHFFTHIAHEIRTPVSLISAPLEKVLSEPDLPVELRKDLDTALRNSENLRHLINQLLDIRKTDKNFSQLDYRVIDVSALIRQIVNLFRPLASKKAICINCQFVDSLLAYTDQDALTKILCNLISNALKYAKNKIDLVLEKTVGDKFSISISDNGFGIEESEKEKIFSLFYRGDTHFHGMMNGFGIGLSLVDMLVKKMDGTITVESKKGEYCTFVLNLPVGNVVDFAQDLLSFSFDDNAIYVDDYVENILDTNITERIHIKCRKQINLLIVEDNNELVHFLKSNFESDYGIYIAKDGIEGLRVMETNQIDLVISDVMMPNMDGIELSSKMKTNIRFSHIPVILLTAKTDTSTKIEGLENGADVYIEKPFSIRHLKAQVYSLLQKRINLREFFSNTPFAPLNSIITTKADEELLKRINDVIEKNICNTEFSVNDIVSSLNMSRSVLYVKIRTIFGLTPNNFIRLVRLRKAAEYLSKAEYRINEVCDMTGFNSPSYFSKCFRKQFGMLPKDFLNER